MKRLRPALFSLLKAVVSLGILAFLFTRVDGIRLLRVLSAAHVGYLVAGLVGYFLGQLVSSVRWTLLARLLGFKNLLRDFVSIYFIGMFFNLFTPSTVGGDFGRVFYLARERVRGQGQDWAGPTARAVISVITDRAVGLAVLLWIGAATLLFFPGYSIPSAIQYLTYGLALASILSWFLLPSLHLLLERKAHPIAENVRLAVGIYQKNPRVLSQTVLLSLTVHVIQAVMQLLLGRALGVDIPLSYCFILYPLVGLFSSLPITLNGFGLREGGYLFLLERIGIPAEKAIAFGLLWFVIVALDSLLGAVVFVLRRAAQPSAAASEADAQPR